MLDVEGTFEELLLYGVTEGSCDVFNKLIPLRNEFETGAMPVLAGATLDEVAGNSCRAAGLRCTFGDGFAGCLVCLRSGLGPGDIALISEVAFCRSLVTNLTHFLMESCNILVESIDPAVRLLLARLARFAARMFVAD